MGTGHRARSSLRNGTEFVRHDRVLLVEVVEIVEVRGKVGPAPGCLLDGVGELGGMCRGQNDLSAASLSLAASSPTAVWGSTSSPVCVWVSAMTSSVSSSPIAAADHRSTTDALVGASVQERRNPEILD